MEICDLCDSRNLCLSKVKLFKELGVDESKSIYLTSIHKDYENGESIFNINDPIDKIIIVRYGKIKTSIYDENGKEYIANIYVKGDIIGDDSIFLERNYETNAFAINKTGICIIDKNTLKNILVKDTEFSIKMINNLSEKLYESQKLLEILSIKEAYKRLAAFLYFRGKLINSNIIELNQETIASSINLSRETVSRKLNELEKEGYIELLTYKKIKIKNNLGLINLTNL